MLIPNKSINFARIIYNIYNCSAMKQIKWFFKTYFTFVLLFLVQKPLFMLFTHSSATQPVDNTFSTMLAVMWHGLTLDLSMAGYLTAIPALLLIASIWLRKELVRPILNGYFAIAALLMSFCFVLNIALYPYWNFPLDSTPLFYFFTSPGDALASVSIWMQAIGLVSLCGCAAVIWLSLKVYQGKKRRSYHSYSHTYYNRSNDDFDRHRGRTSIIMLLLTGLLFLPIRGGVTVSTTNTGKVYFSQNIYVNHAAVNPMFSLMESLTHANNFAQQYRYMDDQEAEKIFRTMVSQSDDNTYPLLNPAAANGKPDILIVIMESFANDLLPSMGTQKDVAVELDSIAQQGILFTRFYANSFRTDRGLVSILSGYPAQPTTSLMRYPAKTAQLPSIARSLSQQAGYKTTYYYGGDVDFANQRSYLVSQGFQKIISDSDFPIDEKLSKWGVHDHLVANRLMEDIKKQQTGGPQLRVFQTSSSHEPFDVPYKRLNDKRLNAFAYTDSVIGSVMRQYSKLPRWKNTLVILVPDHVGAYKENLDNFDRSRYQIPLILTGGAIAKPMKIKLIGSQQDIAATLLGQLHLKHDDFLFSKNMLSDATPKFAFFTVPDAFGVVSEENSLIFDNKAKKAVYNKGTKLGYNIKRGQAYLQKLYDDISKK